MSRNKFHAKGVRTDDGYFHSQGELARWYELKLLEKAGAIKRLERQTPFPLVIDGRAVRIRSQRYPNGRIAKYTADFTYFVNGDRIIEDYKGFDTAESRLRRAIVETIYQCTVTITGVPLRATVRSKEVAA